MKFLPTFLKCSFEGFHIRSLYVHFPFCESKCHYCDFYSLGREKTAPEFPRNFIRSLRNEVQNSVPLLETQGSTIFFGGGTPSMTLPPDMHWGFEPVLDKWRNQTSPLEWTMEANPSSVSRFNLEAYRKMGINRISLGVQSLNPSTLEKLGRVHSAVQVFEALEMIFEAGFENVSVDLLCGVPQQSLEDLRFALTRLTQFPITHLSCYLLTLSQHHWMFSQLPSEQVQLEHYLFVSEFMKDRGFSHYEISNFARAGWECQHHLSCWHGNSYLGMGPSAHSYDSEKKQRWKNVSSLVKYQKLLEKNDSPAENKEILSKAQLELEKWMLNLRLSSGVPDTWLDSATRQQRFQLLQKQGLAENHPFKNDHWRLTLKGFTLLDQIVSFMT